MFHFVSWFYSFDIGSLLHWVLKDIELYLESEEKSGMINSEE